MTGCAGPASRGFGESLGVVGGMGPLAALRFLEHILENTAAAAEREHIRVLLDNDPGIPNRVAAYRGEGPSPIPHILKSIESLASIGAQAVAVPCNAVHFFYDQLPRSLPIPWLNMLEAVAGRISGRLARPLVLGATITISAMLYSKYLPQARYLPADGNARIFRLIEQLKVPGDAALRAAADEVCASVDEAGCDGVLLACTELTGLLGIQERCGVPVIDTSAEYARAIVDRMRPAVTSERSPASRAQRA